MNRAGRLLRTIGGLIAIGAVAYAVFALAPQRIRAQTQAAPPENVPVETARVARQDVPVFLSGIGNVEAVTTVLVRARVDGTLESVAFREGQEVKKGDLLAVIDPRPYKAALDQATAKKAQDEAQLTNAKLDLNRYATLEKQQVASRQSVDTQQALVRQLAAALKSDDAAIETAALNLSFTHITSPIDGRAGLLQIDPGNLIHATDATGIVTITQIHPIEMTFTLPEEDLPQIADALRAGGAKVAAYTSARHVHLADGKLIAVNNAVDATTGTIKLKAEFPNTENRLWPGQFVNAELQVRTDHDAVVVSDQAVQHGPDGLFVYVVKPDHTVSHQDIATSYDNGGISEVTKGLKAGETVVVSGQSRLQDGAHVAARNPPAAPGNPS